jgi:hypothetical protein
MHLAPASGPSSSPSRFASVTSPACQRHKPQAQHQHLRRDRLRAQPAQFPSLPCRQHQHIHGMPTTATVLATAPPADYPCDEFDNKPAAGGAPIILPPSWRNLTGKTLFRITTITSLPPLCVHPLLPLMPTWRHLGQLYQVRCLCGFRAVDRQCCSHAMLLLMALRKPVVCRQTASSAGCRGRRSREFDHTNVDNFTVHLSSLVDVRACRPLPDTSTTGLCSVCSGGGEWGPAPNGAAAEVRGRSARPGSRLTWGLRVEAAALLPTTTCATTARSAGLPSTCRFGSKPIHPAPLLSQVEMDPKLFPQQGTVL